MLAPAEQCQSECSMRKASDHTDLGMWFEQAAKPHKTSLLWYAAAGLNWELVAEVGMHGSLGDSVIGVGASLPCQRSVAKRGRSLN